MTLLTGGVLTFINFVFGIVPVQPTGTNRRLAALGIEVALVAISSKIVTGGAILLGLVAVELGTALGQPRLTHHVGFYFVAVMAAGGVIAVGTVHGMTLLTSGVLAFINFVFGIVPVQPSGTNRRLAALGVEVALATFRRQIMAGGAILLGLVAVKLSIVFIQPRLAHHVVLDFVAVMAAGGVIAVGPI